jgi:hypothetical protein
VGIVSAPEEHTAMKVNIKKFVVEMEVKNNGIEFEVRSTDGKSQIGDCYVTKTGLTWCKGKTTRKNGSAISWAELAEILSSDAAKKAALKAAREA